jgi:hypothetical protein
MRSRLLPHSWLNGKTFTFGKTYLVYPAQYSEAFRLDAHVFADFTRAEPMTVQQDSV